MFKEAMQTFHIGKYFDDYCRWSVVHYANAGDNRASFIYFVQTKLDLFIRCPLADVKKMPLGKLSKTQIAKGFEALEQIQAAVEGLYQNTPWQKQFFWNNQLKNTSVADLNQMAFWRG